MGLRFVLGRSGAGKTRFCHDEIRSRLRENPDGPPLILLVPEQATFQSEYALLKDGGLPGTIRAQALSFRRLAFRVMQETGGTALVPIGENGRNMLLYKIVHRLESELELFRHGADQPGFIERLGDLLTEWKRYGIDAAALGGWIESGAAAAAGTLLARKLRDLRLVYERLEAEMAGLYVDAEDDLAHLAAGFGAAPSMRGAEIWVDGFHGFTPKEYEALGALLRSAARVTVALCLDREYGPGERPHELELFHPTAETYIKLRELAESNGVGLLETIVLDGKPPRRFADSPMLAHLEKHFAAHLSYRPADPGELAADDPRCGISLHAAANRRAEVEAAAQDMVRRARDEGLRWRDMAVIVRNPADYADYAEAVFAEYGIPYFLDQKKTAVHHPLTEFIRSALETVLKGWRYEAVFRCIKTEMLFPDIPGGSRELYDRFENYVLAAGIDGRKWLDRKSWKPLSFGDLEREDGETAPADPREFAAVMEARESIVPPLRRFGQALKRAGSVKEMCAALYRLLDHADAADRLERWSRADLAAGRPERARAHRQLWDGVMELLDQLVELAGDEQMPPELFAGMVETGLESLKLASVPPALDQVLVGSLDRTRSAPVRVCYVLGANDGVMPMRIQEDGVLTEPERERLQAEGLAMAPGVTRRLLDERFLIYVALTTPSRHLWLSWPAADEEGKSLHASEIVRQVKRLFPGLEERAVPGEPSPDQESIEQLRFVSRPERTLSHLIGQLRQWRQGAEIAPFWWDVFNWFAVRPEWQDKLQMLTSSLDYDNRVPSLSPATAKELYGERLTASVSRLERFVSCPFQHFAIHGLRLKERRLYRLEAPDVGQLFHAALSRLAADLGDRWGVTPAGGIRAAAASAVEQLAPRLQSQILLSSGRYRYIARKLTEIVGQAAIILAEHERRAAFRPVGLEVGFGPDGTLPALVVTMADGRTLELVGRIDRIDAARTEEGWLLRVLDYKSSATQLRLEEVAHGLSLQMLAYLDVLLTHAPAWLGGPVAPAGVLYFHVHNPLLAASNGMSPEEARRQLLKRFKMRGLLLADESAVRMMDGELDTGYSDLLPVAIKRDGGFYSSSSVVGREGWEVLRRSVRRSIARIGGEIAQGEIGIAPYRTGAKTPCQYCAYKPVCQFDPLIEGNDYIKLPRVTGDEIWRLLERQAAESGKDAESAPDEAAETPAKRAEEGLSAEEHAAEKRLAAADRADASGMNREYGRSESERRGEGDDAGT
ncbi:helicase-exonuclease AddAB subunit AddB [Paenibacillus cisolokensis]|uniref:helicase-exonuclease AddAB subunit AddB n=1 Tax=Paenibacillus cisolokensis TaxID=1658519 RepID=UPI003D2ABFCF